MSQSLAKATWPGGGDMGEATIMDFGLGKYLEMFEERFGHRAATGLIFFITLGLIAVLLPLIMHNLVGPVMEGFNVLSGGNLVPTLTEMTWRDYIEVIGSLFLAMGCVVPMMFFLIARSDAKYQLQMRRMNRLRQGALGGRIDRNAERAKRKRWNIVLALFSGILLIIMLGALTLLTVDKSLLRLYNKKADALQAQDLHLGSGEKSLRFTEERLKRRVDALETAVKKVCDDSPSIRKKCDDAFRTISASR